MCYLSQARFKFLAIHLLQPPMCWIQPCNIRSSSYIIPFFKDLIILVCVCMYTHMYHMCADVCGDKKTESEPLELELWAVGSCQ